MFHKLRKILTRAEKFKLVSIAVLMVIGSLLELMAVAIFDPFIEVLMQTDSGSESAILRMIRLMFYAEEMEQLLIILSVLIAVIYVVKNVFLIALQAIILSFSYKMRMRLSVKLLVTYMDEPYTFHLSRNVAEMQRSLLSDCNQFMTLINSVLQIMTELVTCGMLVVYLLFTSRTITLVIGALLLLCIAIFTTISRNVSGKLGRRNEIYNARLYQWINQSLGGIKEVKILQREKFFVDSYERNYKEVIWGARLNELLAVLPKYIVEMVAMVGLVIAIIFKLLFGQGYLDAFLPQIAVFAVAAFRLLPSVGRLNSYVNSIMYHKAALDMVYQDLTDIEENPPLQSEWKEECPAQAEDAAVSSADDHLSREGQDWSFRTNIRVDHVTYHYPNTDTVVLEDVSLEIPKGMTVALIGPSGAGKTTLADIILGLLPPTQGHVYMDDHDVFLSLKRWRSKLGYIPQTIYLSDDTIRNNVAFGIFEDQIDDGAVWAALEKAQLKEFVEGLEDGLDAHVGDRGVRISGGQRQRIGIARALYHDPEILVLDEATSALDNETEQAVMEAIDSLQGLKTMIIIAHRLTTIRNADRIYEVSGGKVTLRDKTEVFPS